MIFPLILNGWYWRIDILQVKDLNNIIEQDRRFIKKLTRQVKGFKSFSSASATLEGIEFVPMIRKRQFEAKGQSAFQQFAALAGQLCPAQGHDSTIYQNLRQHPRRR